MNPVNHFEISFDNEKAIDFYKDIFGWKVDAVPGMPYWMAHTCEVNEKYMCKEPNTINGGMFKRNPELSNGPIIVITVPNVEKHLKKIESAGGQKIFGPQTVGDMGIYAQFKDTEGNILGLWEILKKE